MDDFRIQYVGIFNKGGIQKVGVYCSTNEITSDLHIRFFEQQRLQDWHGANTAGSKRSWDNCCITE